MCAFTHNKGTEVGERLDHPLKQWTVPTEHDLRCFYVDQNEFDAHRHSNSIMCSQTVIKTYLKKNFNLCIDCILSKCRRDWRRVNRPVVTFCFCSLYTALPNIVGKFRQNWFLWISFEKDTITSYALYLKHAEKLQNVSSIGFHERKRQASTKLPFYSKQTHIVLF